MNVPTVKLVVVATAQATRFELLLALALAILVHPVASDGAVVVLRKAFATSRSPTCTVSGPHVAAATAHPEIGVIVA